MIRSVVRPVARQTSLAGSALGFSIVFAMAESSTNGISKLLERLVNILKEEHTFDRSGDHPVVQFLHPVDLQKKIPLSLDSRSTSDEELEKAIRLIIQYSVKTFNPHFHNQLYAGVDEYGLIGAWLTDALNTSQYTYEVAPVFTLIEQTVIQESLKLVRYLPTSYSDGIMTPGGSISNMYGMMLARYRLLPQIKQSGLSGLPPLACFTSESGHYSIMKGAHWLGLGTDNVHQVKTDEFGRMEPNDLKRAIAAAKCRGHIPFFVNATCGTTVLGAFDPLPEISAICKKEEMWLHVDACLGGSLLLSRKYQRRLHGIELSDSVAWNPHKMLGAPLQCSLFLVKDKTLHLANCANAKYLFQQDKFYDVNWDTGDKSVQCGRKVDAMKLWLMWKARGTKGLERSIDQAMSYAEYFLKRIKNTAGFRLVLPDFECNNICFWYIPMSMRGEKETPEWWKKLYKITSKIKERMTLEGSLMIGYTPLPQKNLGNFFRMVVNCQPPPTESSMDYVIQEIEKYALKM